MIAVKCPSDGTLHYAEDGLVGKTIRCRTCGANLKIGPQGQPTAEENKPVPAGLATDQPKTAEVQPETWTKDKPTEKAGGWGYILGGAALVGCVLLLLFFYRQNTAFLESNQTPAGSTSRSASEHSPDSSSNEGNLSAMKHKPKVEQARANLSSVTSGADTPPPPCAQGREPTRLQTGQMIEPEGETLGQSNIRIMNASDLDVVVVLSDVVTGNTSRFVYIRAGNSFALEGIKAGTYKLRFQFGRDWIADCREFVRDSVYGEFLDSFAFFDDRIRFYTVTLSPHIGGATRTRKIDRKKFYEGDQGVVNPQ